MEAMLPAGMSRISRLALSLVRRLMAVPQGICSSPEQPSRHSSSDHDESRSDY